MAAAPLIELDSRNPKAVDGRQIRAVAFHDVRLAYVRGALERLGLTAAGSRAVVVGGGRGPLPEGLARLGFDVVAVDPSATATAMAREAAEREGLAIDHRTAPAEEPGLPDAAFDVAYYCDTFEITPHLDTVIGHAARVLSPGGALVYDTVNRTLLSRLVYLGAFQSFPLTSIMPAGRYAAERLRTPTEIAEAMSRHGLRGEDVCDFKPRSPVGLVKAVVGRRRGRITDEQIPPIVGFSLSPGARPLVTYLGCARKA
ncbi:methyltransferase domain-containing protein [Streptomyces sp. NPDC004647]|uniref:methyltransferase domain-containing protein n=1 Tax=Streptomyces sp. NPDC004647 TaxID=3154671 RepID=UPI0033AAA7DE